MIKLNSFESLQSLGATYFVLYFANQNIKLKIYRILIGSFFLCFVTNFGSHTLLEDLNLVVF